MLYRSTVAFWFNPDFGAQHPEALWMHNPSIRDLSVIMLSPYDSASLAVSRCITRFRWYWLLNFQIIWGVAFGYATERLSGAHQFRVKEFSGKATYHSIVPYIYAYVYSVLWLWYCALIFWIHTKSHNRWTQLSSLAGTQLSYPRAPPLAAKGHNTDS